MERDFFDFIVKDLPKDSVKRACYVVREYRRCEINNCMSYCAVSKEEYNYALSILLAYAYTTCKDKTVPELWKCDGDCNRNNGIGDFCPGEFQVSNESGKKMCKYFSDPSDI